MSKKSNYVADENCYKKMKISLGLWHNFGEKDVRITSVLIGAIKTAQILDSVKAIKNTTFSEEKLTKINDVLK
jgi:hypothetical protein